MLSYCHGTVNHFHWEFKTVLSYSKPHTFSTFLEKKKKEKMHLRINQQLFLMVVLNAVTVSWMTIKVSGEFDMYHVLLRKSNIIIIINSSYFNTFIIYLYIKHTFTDIHKNNNLESIKEDRFLRF